MQAVSSDILMTGDRPDATNVVILLSDGASNVNPEQTIPAAAALKDGGAVIYTIGLGEGGNPTELEEIASLPQAPFVQSLQRESDLATMIQTSKLTKMTPSIRQVIIEGVGRVAHLTFWTMDNPLWTKDNTIWEITASSSE